MKIFIDTANLQEIEEALKRGFVDGVTTNPSLLAKEPKGKFEDHIGKIIELVKRYKNGAHVSVEVFSRNPEEILRQAKQFRRDFAYDALSVKVQIGWDELGVIKTLDQEGVSVNCTACMCVTQAVMAARAGARYVSFFWGRIRDGGLDDKFKEQREQAFKNKVLDRNDFDPAIVVTRARSLLERGGLKTEIIAGSMRSVVDIRDAALAGAHIVTVPSKFFREMVTHFKTEEVVKQFLADFENWLK